MTNDKGILIKNIYYMLSYAFQILKQGDYEKVAAEKFDKINDLFAAILVKGVSRQLKQGLYREYVPIQENLSVMRGKVNISDTVKLKSRCSQKLACEYDDFSENNIYNQILKTTIYRLVRSKDVDKQQIHDLKKILLFFGNVNLTDTNHIQWPKLIYRRNNRNYELLLNICYFILTSLLQTTDKGEFKLLSFSDEHMEMLFQRFVMEYYRQHYKDLHPKAQKIDWNITDGNDGDFIKFLPSMQTDITLKNGNKTLIIDTKYYGKIMAENYKSTYRSAHLYQIFSYVKNMDKDDTGNVSGLLLYAKTEEDNLQDERKIVISNNPIGIKTLNLNSDFKDIACQLDEIIIEYL